MHDEDTAVHRQGAPSAAVDDPGAALERPPAGEQWPEQTGELAPRPRRRLLTPMALALLAVLLGACGFIGGVLVQKGQTSSSGSASAGSSLASRLAALRGAGAGGGAPAGAGVPGSGTGRTAGQVAFIQGSTLYVTTAEGNTVKVTAAAGTSVTKTVKTSVGGIHPGESVLVTGASGAGGAVSAESIRVGESSEAGGLSALLGAGGAGAGGGPKRAPSGGASGGEPALFGKG
jgi:hypothetical protein